MFAIGLQSLRYAVPQVVTVLGPTFGFHIPLETVHTTALKITRLLPNDTAPTPATEQIVMKLMAVNSTDFCVTTIARAAAATETLAIPYCIGNMKFYWQC